MSIKTNISEEELYLAQETELFEEAKDIARKTAEDEIFPFVLQYDANQKDFLRSMLQTVGADVEAEDGESHTLTVQLNMAQLKLIKSLDCVKRVRTDEGTNAKIADKFVDEAFAVEDSEALIEENAATIQTARVMTHATDETAGESVISLETNEPAVASVNCAAKASSCCCPSNTTMESAKTITVESLVSGRICCPGAEQWFQFTVPQSGTYTVYTMGSLDTIGDLYDCGGNLMASVDDYAPCGKLNFRIIYDFNANATYYVRVTEAKSNTGEYYLQVTQNRLVDYVSIHPSSIILEKGKTYELPMMPNTFVNISGTERLNNLTASVVPSAANEQGVTWLSSDNNIIHVNFGWLNDEAYETVTAKNAGVAKLYAYDLNGDGKRGECTVYISEIAADAPKVTVISCSDPGWIASSETMGRDMASAFDCEGRYIVETPKTAAEFEACWSEANECIVIHTHGSPSELCDQVGDLTPTIITKEDIKNLPINTRIRFIMMTACETAGGTAAHNVAYWLSKRINPNGIVIANTDRVTGTDTDFWGSKQNQTWKVYKDGVIHNPISEVTLTMSSAYDIYRLYK